MKLQYTLTSTPSAPQKSEHLNLLPYPDKNTYKNEQDAKLGTIPFNSENNLLSCMMFPSANSSLLPGQITSDKCAAPQGGGLHV